MYAWLQAAIAENAQIVTASRRLARELRGEFSAQQIASGHTAWLTPSIHSWHEWLSRQAGDIGKPAAIPNRLDTFSSAWLMERSIRAQLPDGMPGVGGIVRQAVQSWQRLREWQVPHAEFEMSARSPDEQLFARAIADYELRLKDGAWTDGAGAADLVADLIATKQIVVPAQMVLAGFDRLSPAAQNVIDALKEAGCTVVAAAARDVAANVSVQAFDSTECELRAAGAWARSQLNDNPQARIAIVSPVLESNAPEITRLIREGLVPGWQYGGTAFATAANVSYGRKLVDYPAIAIALLLLRWTHQGLTSRELSTLLRSPCIAGQQINGRGRVELLLRGHPDRPWSIDAFLRVFRGVDDSPDVIEFFDCITELAKIGAGGNKMEGPAEWAARIDAVLKAAHWPGDASLDSHEFQLINRWRKLLNEFARMEVVTPRIALADACQRLTSLASDTLFQPESGRGLVQVLGMLEAAGMEFDHLWICGLDATQWPPVSRPAPLISNALQRKFDMPDATPHDTLGFARRLIGRLTASANDCVLSWASIRDDLELTPSSLVEAYGGTAGAIVTDPGWYARSLVGRTNLEICDDDVAPPVRPDEHVRGGAYTVQRQYIEPFSAFVHGRLGVRPPEPIATGLSPGVRGNIIHNALHNLLAGKPGQRAIREWSAENREQRIGSAIDSALAEHALHADAVTRHIIGLERQRLRQLLDEFISTELEREEFSVVDVEKKVDFEAFGVRLGLRIDRVDRLANGRLLVIDYKTGLSKHFLGRTGDPVDLQLIVYADALKSDIGGLALINVDSTVISYKGAGGEGGPWKAFGDDEWNTALDSWQSMVRKSMCELAAGDVRIDLAHKASEGRPLNILSRKEEQKRAD